MSVVLETISPTLGFYVLNDISIIIMHL
uniref:Uncharacterized protein n=1 Tax=Rhizophora mucronata TaxID=61149 RepID=A0A2P2QLZ0_RHIMU